MASGRIVAEREGRILRVTIDRPDKRNALSRALLGELRETFNAHAGEETLSVAVLTGAGERSFAAGGDLADLAVLRTSEEASEMARDAKSALDAVRYFPVPVVAALNGDALGGGAELATACDFRIAARHARIGFIQGRLNISTAWGGGIDLLARLGPTAALRLMARSELMDAEEARGAGLVDEVAAEDASLGETVEAFIAPIAAQVPQVSRAFKALARSAADGARRAELETLETEKFAVTWVHDDHWEAADKVLNPRRRA